MAAATANRQREAAAAGLTAEEAKQKVDANPWACGQVKAALYCYSRLRPLGSCWPLRAPTPRGLNTGGGGAVRACAQLVNHPPAGHSPNVRATAINVGAEGDSVLGIIGPAPPEVSPVPPRWPATLRAATIRAASHSPSTNWSRFALDVHTEPERARASKLKLRDGIKSPVRGGVACGRPWSG